MERRCTNRRLQRSLLRQRLRDKHMEEDTDTGRNKERRDRIRVTLLLLLLMLLMVPLRHSIVPSLIFSEESFSLDSPLSLVLSLLSSSSDLC
jgi:hypothetical protein